MTGLVELDESTLSSYLVFYDFETTDLNVRVPTELSLIAISVNNFLEDVSSDPLKLPRVLHKLLIPTNPMIAIHPKVNILKFHAQNPIFLISPTWEIFLFVVIMKKDAEST